VFGKFLKACLPQSVVMGNVKEITVKIDSKGRLCLPPAIKKRNREQSHPKENPRRLPNNSK
jgi:hypothetical protein